MRKIIYIVSVVALVAVFLGSSLAIGAESDKPSRKKPSEGIGIELSKEEIPQLVEIIRIWKLVDELKLKEEQLVKFLPKERALSDLRKKYYEGMRMTRDQLEKLLETNPSEAQLKSAMDAMDKTEAEYRQKSRQLEDERNATLTIHQKAKFIVFEYEYRHDMGRLIKSLQELSNLREQGGKPAQSPPGRKKEE